VVDEFEDDGAVDEDQWSGEGLAMKDDGDDYIVADEEGLGMINGIEGCVMSV